ncbi:MAG: phytanoyl-CoA dioxygenase family protein [Paracoccaceae bacterium]
MARPYEYTPEDIPGDGFAERLQRDGFCLIRGFFSPDDLRPIWTDLANLVTAFARANGITLDDVPDGQIDRQLVTLLQERPDLQGTLYDRLQLAPGILSTPSHAKFRDLASRLFSTDAFGVWPRVQVRLDLFKDVKNVIEWHHDYLYNQGTKSSWTVWMPLVDISTDMGQLSIAPGTHRVEIPFEFIRTGGGNRFDYTLDAETVSGLDLVRPEGYRAGDLVLFHSMVVHAGAENRTKDRARLVQLFRMQNVNDLEAFETSA